MANKLQIQLVLWNGSKYIPSLFESLRQQSFKDWKLMIFDNQSSDDTVLRVRHELNNFNQPYELIENDSNSGFAGGHNRLLKKAESKYVLFLNQDMYLEKDCLEKMIFFMDSEQRVAAVAPRLMRWDYSKGIGAGFLDQVDSLGLKVYRNRRVVEYCHGEAWPIDKLAKQNYVDVFGLSGALPMYRLSDIKNIYFQNGDLYDESYNSYKEDVDLAFRMQSAGLNSAVLLNAVTYHDRTAEGAHSESDLAAVKNKKKQSHRVQYLSYRNHLATIYKNEYIRNLFFDFPWIFWYEIKKFIYYLFFNRAILKGWIDLMKIRKDLKQKRKEINQNKSGDYLALRRWWYI